MNDYRPVSGALAGIKVIDVDTGDLWTSRAHASIREDMPQHKMVPTYIRGAATEALAGRLVRGPQPTH